MDKKAIIGAEMDPDWFKKCRMKKSSFPG